MSVFEIVMLGCFGAGWPVSILKSLRTKHVKGKSLSFMYIIFAGYLSGILHKVFYSFDYVIILYIINLVLVTIDISLYYKYIKK